MKNNSPRLISQIDHAMVLKNPQRINVFENAEQHHDKMLMTVEALHISLATFCVMTNLKDFSLIKQF